MIEKDAHDNYVPPVPKRRAPTQQMEDDLRLVRKVDRMLVNAVMSIRVERKVLHPRERQMLNDLARTLAVCGRDT